VHTSRMATKQPPASGSRGGNRGLHKGLMGAGMRNGWRDLQNNSRTCEGQKGDSGGRRHGTRSFGTMALGLGVFGGVKTWQKKR